ncbi:MAG: acetyl-CoA/propionyl-CoA carboxylase, biotin carboxylase, biotin carboxyl carrier protein [Gaiellales bacterium]|jgi:acetyl-CoA/propionyl-CoA carboxylase biotin carboxyl carrier protein|nr:acetyl-CoA/propionyl-CoA carboxylase, biotin carboxylase, biotin carboxyl carrier protein [Gaiellales bacterium]
MFRKVLVANRGEIAIRIFRTLREMGIASVAVYSEADRDAPFVSYADDAYLIGGPSPAQSYLQSESIIRTAKRAGAEAIHPGFGFLAENADFARACAAAGLVFVGPPPEAIEAMGSKVSARRAMEAAGVPVIPGTVDPVETVEDAVRAAAEIGYPVAVKASAGGGGKGIEVAHNEDELRRGYEAARRQGKAYFADDTVFLERYLDDPRHIEVQVMADSHGAVVHLGERDCSIQRRHQKIVEETPSPAVSPELRERIGRIGVEAARAVGYVNAGTVEGLLDRDGTYYFLEMNTRLQVEHTVTEMVTGIDLVREQLRIAAGEPLGFSQDGVELRGHSIQCRINAEDPMRDFVPTPGRITRYREPSGPGVRVDSGVVEGSTISELYDPMIAKLVVWDADRDLARRRMLRALSEFEIGGVKSLIPIHKAIMEHPEFAAGGTLREFVEGGGYARHVASADGAVPADGAMPDAAAQDEARTLVTEVDGRRFEVTVVMPEHPGRTRLRARRSQLAERSARHGGGQDVIRSPMQGTVLKVSVDEGDGVEAGQVLVVVEAMKMENEIVAHHAGTVDQVSVGAGDLVSSGQELLRLA